MKIAPDAPDMDTAAASRPFRDILGSAGGGTARYFTSPSRPVYDTIYVRSLNVLPVQKGQCPLSSIKGA
jgi:hypothetical protein